MARKLKRSKTPTDKERIASLERRLDCAVQESRRMRDELEALQAKDPLADLRDALQRSGYRERRRKLSTPPSLDTTFDPDDTIN